jgi:hypothetical protein
MTDLATQERAVLDLLRDTYEQQGMTFITYPLADMVPAFLGGYRPDAIAASPNGGVVIEVVAGSNSNRKLKDIATKFAGHPEWTLRIVRADDPAVRYSTSLNDDQISSALAEAERAARQGLWRSALLIGWASLESVARARLASVVADASRPLQPLTVVSSLEQFGFITNERAEALRKAARVRNLIAHGDFTQDEPLESVVQAVLSVVRELGASVPVSPTH